MPWAPLALPDYSARALSWNTGTQGEDLSLQAAESALLCSLAGCDDGDRVPIWLGQRAVCGRAVLQPGGHVRCGRRAATCRHG